MNLKSGKIIPFREAPVRKKQSVLEQLFTEHEAPLRAFLRVRLNGHAGDIEDVIQDVYVRLARLDDLLEKVNRQNGSTRAYLFSIANNLVVDRARHAQVCKRYQLLEQGEAGRTDTQITPEHDLIAKEELQYIKKVVMALPNKCRRAFLMSRMKHMSYRQIAEELGVSVKRVEKYISRALGAIRQDREGREYNVKTL